MMDMDMHGHIEPLKNKPSHALQVTHHVDYFTILCTYIWLHGAHHTSFVGAFTRASECAGSGRMRRLTACEARRLHTGVAGTFACARQGALTCLLLGHSIACSKASTSLPKTTT